MLDVPSALAHGAIVRIVRHRRQTATASFQGQTVLIPSGYFRTRDRKKRTDCASENTFGGDVGALPPVGLWHTLVACGIPFWVEGLQQRVVIQLALQIAPEKVDDLPSRNLGTPPEDGLHQLVETRTSRLSRK
jgi:hypothetical protein